MRKAEAASSGKHATVVIMEASVRAMEAAVQRGHQTTQAARARLRAATTAQSKFEAGALAAPTRLSGLRSRFKAVKRCADEGPDIDADARKLLWAANRQQAQLRIRPSSAPPLSQAEQRQFAENLAEAARLQAVLERIGFQRQSILEHALNGLANLKVAAAEGKQDHQAVFQHLYGLIHESETMAMPHSNAEVKLHHCLRLCEKRLDRSQEANAINSFEAQVEALEALFGRELQPAPGAVVQVEVDKGGAEA